MERPDVEYLMNKGQYGDVGGGAVVDLCAYILHLEAVIRGEETL